MSRCLVCQQDYFQPHRLGGWQKSPIHGWRWNMSKKKNGIAHWKTLVRLE
jgi:hypothetical protein